MVRKIYFVFLIVIFSASVFLFTTNSFAAQNRAKLNSEEVAAGKMTVPEGSLDTLYTLDIIELNKEILSQGDDMLSAIQQNSDLLKKQNQLLQDMKSLLKENLQKGMGAE